MWIHKSDVSPQSELGIKVIENLKATISSRESDRSKTPGEFGIFQIPGWPDKSDDRNKREDMSSNAMVKAEFNKQEEYM